MPLAEIQTDDAVARSAGGAADRTLGYVVPHLDGIWLRGPYLHNGSVPTIRDLLTPAKQRPTRFYRGHDLLDFEKSRIRVRGDRSIGPASRPAFQHGKQRKREPGA